VVARAGQRDKVPPAGFGLEIERWTAWKALASAIGPGAAGTSSQGSTGDRQRNRFSAAIAANAVSGAWESVYLALGCHALMVKALVGHEEPFLPFVHACKPHPGQVWVARIMRELLGIPTMAPRNPGPTRASTCRIVLRCAVCRNIWADREGLRRIRETVEVEMNAITDNPLIDGDAGRFYQSGNFLGQYLGVAMDDLRRDLGLSAKHLDVQLRNWWSPAFNHGLPASLHGNGERSFNMGLKGLRNHRKLHHADAGFPRQSTGITLPTHAEQYKSKYKRPELGGSTSGQQYVDMATQLSICKLDLRRSSGGYGTFRESRAL